MKQLIDRLTAVKAEVTLMAQKEAEMTRTVFLF